MASSSGNSLLRRPATWVVGWRLIGIFATLATNILAARLLGPADFGVFLLITTMIAIGGMLGTAGLNEAGLRFIAESLALDRLGLARAYVRRTLATVALASLAAAIVVSLIVSLFQFNASLVSESGWLILLAGLGVLALSWLMVSAESLRGFGDLRLASLFSGGQTGGPVANLVFLACLLVAAFVVSRLSASLAVAMLVLSIAVACPLALISLRRTSDALLPGAGGTDGSSATLSRVQNKELLAVGGILLLNQLLAFGSQQLDIWMGGAMLDPEHLGLYGAAKRSLLLAAMPVQMAMMTVMAAVPRLQAQKRTRDLECVVRSAATYAAIPAILALGALLLFPGPILQLIFGGSYAGAASIVMVMVLGHVVLVLSGNPPYVMTMSGKHRTVLVVNLMATVVLLAVGFLGARFFGAVGLAAGSAASVAFQNGALWWLARRELGVWTHVGMPLRSCSSRSNLSPGAVAEA